MNKYQYQDMRFLIVDNIKPSQDILKQFVMRSTTKPVDSTHYSQDVASICQQKSYDVILLGYDLGENQKNGQQILEELRVNSYINRHCIVILITAEVSQSMVLAALEHKPEHYLCKPYTLSDLDKRLRLCLQKKNAMKNIYQAMDDDNPELVVRRCKEALENNTPYRTECLGIISRQYFDLQQYDDAKSIYIAQHKRINCQWATIGLGKIALQENKLNEAEKLFKLVINEDPLYLSSYDWLATTYEEQFRYLLAEEILQKALQLSPRSLGRLQKYAKLCMQNENFSKATTAYENTYKLAHNSIHHNPDNTINYVNAVIEHSPSLSLTDSKVINNKALSFLKQMTKDFKTSEIKVHSHFLGACLFEIIKEKELAKDEILKGEKLLTTEQDNISADKLIQISKTLTKLNKQNLAKQLLSASEERTQTSHRSIKDKAQAYIEMALVLYSQKKYQAAIHKLEQALKMFPTHCNLKLNLIQVLLVTYDEIDQAKVLLHKAKQNLEELKNMDLDIKEQERLKKMQKKYQLAAGI